MTGQDGMGRADSREESALKRYRNFTRNEPNFRGVREAKRARIQKQEGVRACNVETSRASREQRQEQRRLYAE